ncbi:predicted protein [Uncinocarpus reesii 1704]|uniref:Spindle pole body-associated protein cut12 domain-containing protein n=1 Tax=Uncinocarpus reesii (strain UAMH 1704) TaxID=336963 RepID=C4JNQ2_UNCRE|nr:uncharacterized protein UREG_04372 [Uncinocarpus reesii 1704]EEP79526.1 predicted protein [Uncinocarpus reesii 1704]
MLGWLANAGRGEGIDGPETPAPVFAYKAFKNAVLGTPGDVDADRELTIPIKSLNSTYQRSDGLMKKLEQARLEEKGKAQPQGPLPLPKEPTQFMPSPTKSILVTPGAAAGRRKTVSFGEGVIDNERRRSTFEASSKKDLLSGNISRHWPAPTSDPSKRIRGKSAQSPFNGHKTTQDDELFNIVGEKKVPPVDASAQSTTPPTQNPTEDAEDDSTTNLNEPHSQSGKYWKAEYESYRTKSDREIKKLIEYRRLTRSFARKKDEQVIRLTDKLKQEEEKLKEMESCLAGLASRMADKINTGEPKNEDMVKELSQQTALTLKHKHKAASFRKALEKHGVLDSDESSLDDESKHDALVQKLRRAQEELDQANTQLKAEEKSKDFMNLQALAQESERKAKELESENLSLKRELAKIKKEISGYEDRRKANEGRLKRKQETLESRVKEYSERLRDSSKAHHEAESALKKTFDAEKREMQEVIESLRAKVANAEKTSSTRELSPKKRQVDVLLDQEHESISYSGHRRESKAGLYAERGRSTQKQTRKPMDQASMPNASQKDPQLSSMHEPDGRATTPVLLDSNYGLPSPNTIRRRQNNLDLITSARLLQSQRSRSVSPKKSMAREDYLPAALSSRPSMELSRDRKTTPSQLRQTKFPESRFSRQTTSKPLALNRQLSLASDNHLSASAAAAELKASSPERFAAAKARLQRSGNDDGNKVRPQGKENMWTAV